MTFTFLITAAVLIILLIIPQIMKRVVYKKLTGYLSEREIMNDLKSCWTDSPVHFPSSPTIESTCG